MISENLREKPTVSCPHQEKHMHEHSPYHFVIRENYKGGCEEEAYSVVLKPNNT